MNRPRLFALTLLAMLAFAGNSILCRLALKQTSIDPASFTLIRMSSGAIVLWLIVTLRRTPWRNGGDWTAASALFVYAASFSFAYVSLSAGTGALLLFGAVQATMILWGIRSGERLHARQLIGLSLALTGLLVLVFPGLAAPPLGGSLLMVTAGVAWGIYSLRGKGAGDPTSATAGNFIRAVPFAAVMSVLLLSGARIDGAGLSYAIASGAVASGLGYVVWYTALPALRATSAATVQLSVPVLAAVAGIILLGELITVRFLLSSVAILGGIALVVIGRTAHPAASKSANRS